MYLTQEQLEKLDENEGRGMTHFILLLGFIMGTVVMAIGFIAGLIVGLAI